MSTAPIVVLEDEDSARWELQEFLGKRYPVLAFSSGREAVENVRLHGASLLLADIRMSTAQGGTDERPDGIDAAREILAMHPDAGVVFVTAYSHDQQYRQRVLEAGLVVQGWIAKPLLGDERCQLECIVKREMDFRLMRRILTELASRGLPLPQALAAVDAMASMQDLSEEALARLRKESGVDSLPDVISDFRQALKRVREDFDVIEDRQLGFHHMKDIALLQLPTVCRFLDQGTRRMALLLRMGIRQMKGLELTYQQLDALEYALTKLQNNRVSEEDRSACRWRLRQAGVQTMMSLGAKTGALQEIYDDSDEGEDLVS